MPANTRPCCTRLGFSHSLITLTVTKPDFPRTEVTMLIQRGNGLVQPVFDLQRFFLTQGITAEAAYDIEKDVGRTFPGLAK